MVLLAEDRRERYPSAPARAGAGAAGDCRERYPSALARAGAGAAGDCRERYPSAPARAGAGVAEVRREWHVSALATAVVRHSRRPSSWAAGAHPPTPSSVPWAMAPRSPLGAPRYASGAGALRVRGAASPFAPWAVVRRARRVVSGSADAVAS